MEENFDDHAASNRHAYMATYNLLPAQPWGCLDSLLDYHAYVLVWPHFKIGHHLKVFKNWSSQKKSQNDIFQSNKKRKKKDHFWQKELTLKVRIFQSW